MDQALACQLEAALGAQAVGIVGKNGGVAMAVLPPFALDYCGARPRCAIPQRAY